MTDSWEWSAQRESVGSRHVNHWCSSEWSALVIQGIHIVIKISYHEWSKFRTQRNSLNSRFYCNCNKELFSTFLISMIQSDSWICNGRNSNYKGISLWPTTYKILPNILLSRSVPYTEEIIGDHQCGFRCNRSTADHILCIRQILEKKWEHSEAEHQLFIDFKKAYDSVRREVLCNILMKFGILKKLTRLIKLWLTETDNRVRVEKKLSDVSY